MKRILKTLSVLLTVAMVVLLAGLTISAAEKPALSSSELTLAVGYSGKLTVSGDYKSIEWTSSDESVCTVKNGKVTAVSTGKATVTAKADSCKLTCKVKVYKSCFGEYSPQSVRKGKTLTLKIPAYGVKKAEAYVTDTDMGKITSVKISKGYAVVKMKALSSGDTSVCIYDTNSPKCRIYVGVHINYSDYKYEFRTEDALESHYKKHKDEFGNITQDEYLAAANRIITSDSKDILHKYEKDDGDPMYFDKKTGALLIMSSDGFIRTFFIPEDGLEYWERK